MGFAKRHIGLYLCYMSRYINPYTDFGFKKLFGEERNKDLLIDFLNELLPPKHQIAKLDFNNPEQLPDLPEQRKAFFDIHCTAKSGEHFIVEMQKAKVQFFKDRALFYSTFPVRDQAQRGDWDFRLNDVYFIAILDFEYDEEEERRKLLRHVQLKDQDGDLFYSKLHFKFVQMPLFTKEEHELETHFDKWLYFLKRLTTFEDIPAILKEPVFQKAFKTAELAKMSQKQRNEYEKSRISYFETNALVSSAELRGELRGIEKGRELEAERKDYALVARLLSKGISIKEISELSGIDIERVTKIEAELNAQ
jgi:predicted transposase/invertase (TIGR01784 family)